MKYIFQLLILLFSFGNLSAQNNLNLNKQIHATPKLVVGVVVDQMRYDYITRFWDRFGENGFKELISEGFICKNNHYNYIPTYTGPGHASIYTGATPQTHGIISNNWYDKFKDQKVYCVADQDVTPVGTSSPAGKMSPHRMLTTTVADQNRLHTQMRGKTIGVAIKDRGAILPAGHAANAAYWFHGADEGQWISSSYYMDELPEWVKQFNTSGKAESYLKDWNTLYDIDSYTESGNDLNNFEGGFDGKKTATFPYKLKALMKGNGGFSILKSTPYGNSLTTDFAIAAIENEELGQDAYTDFLTVSFSSTDYVGHNFGVNSKEVEDTYLRLDQDISRLLNALNNKVGKGNYTLFLTADHGAVQVPAYLASINIPAGYFDSGEFSDSLHEFVAQEFGTDSLIRNISNSQVFLNYNMIEENEINTEEIQNAIARFALNQDEIYKVFTREQLESITYSAGIPYLLDNGFNQKRSGDVVYVLKPGFLASHSKTGTSHGSGQNYDTHVPLIFYGNGINKGSTLQRTEIVDIAPTISALLGISFPNAATGAPVEMVID